MVLARDDSVNGSDISVTGKGASRDISVERSELRRKLLRSSPIVFKINSFSTLDSSSSITSWSILISAFLISSAVN